MKKNLCIALLFAVLTGAAQDRWDSVISNGMGQMVNFSVLNKFQGRLFVGGDSGHASVGRQANPGQRSRPNTAPRVSGASTVKLFSSSNGNPGSFAEETGFYNVTQGGDENRICASAANNNYLFIGSSTNYSSMTPQVYRYDGTTWIMHDTIHMDTSGVNMGPGMYGSSVSALALFSPGGTNDSIYAFVNAGIDVNYNTLYSSIYKSSVTNPHWVNAGRFSQGSGISYVNAAIVWKNRLYICTNGRDSVDVNFNEYYLSYILSTANGVTWDTVARNVPLAIQAGDDVSTHVNASFSTFAIHNDTLLVGMSGTTREPVWYTTDSTATPTWKMYLDTAGYQNIYSQWSCVVDLRSFDNHVWIKPGMNSGNYDIYRYSASEGISKMYNSTATTIIEDYSNYYSSGCLLDFNNSIYNAGLYDPFAGASYYDGVMWRFTAPMASFTDSVPANYGFCVNVGLNLTSTSTNNNTNYWYLDNVLIDSAASFTYGIPTPGVHQIKLIVYSDSIGSWSDSAMKTLTIYPNPIIDTVILAKSIICAGEPDTISATVHPGQGPIIYMWSQGLNIISANGSVIPFTYTFSPGNPIPIGFTAMDSNACQTIWPYPFSVTVNASDSLSGVVIDTLLNPVSAGNVYLFRLNPLNPQPGDTAGIFALDPTGVYTFPSLLYGDYIAKAVADTTNPLYKTSVGTYYSNKQFAFQWDSALVIQHHTCVGGNVSGNDIQVLQIRASSLTGPGTISGYVTEDTSYGGARYANGGMFLPSGAPLKGVDVKLGKNPGGNPAARTTTGNDGSFTFTNVPLGSYRIYIDIPNYGMDSVRAVTIDTAQLNSTHNDYYVDSTMIRVVPIDTVLSSICSGDSVLLQGLYQTLAGTYIDTLASGGHDSLVVTKLSVKPLPTLTVTTSADTICNGSSAVLTAAGNSTAYLWSANAGSVTTGTVSVSPASTSVYTVTGSLNGCATTKTIGVAVKNCVGIEAMQGVTFAVYPNPATDKLFVQSQQPGRMRIVSVTGQIVLEQAVNAGVTEIGLGSLAAGAYGVSVTAKGQAHNTRIVVNK